MNVSDVVSGGGSVGFVFVSGPSIFLADVRGLGVLFEGFASGCEGSGASPFLSEGDGAFFSREPDAPLRIRPFF